MSENKFKGPTVMYGPKGESAVFEHHAEVPEGWLDDPAKHEAPVKATSVAPAKLSLTHKEMVEVLEKGGIPHDPKAQVAILDAVLREAVTGFLTDAKVEFDPAADTKTLVELLPKPE